MGFDGIQAKPLPIYQFRSAIETVNIATHLSDFLLSHTILDICLIQKHKQTSSHKSLMTFVSLVGPMGHAGTNLFQ